MALLVTILGICFAVNLPPGETYFGDSLGLRIGFGVVFALTGLVVLGQFVLWLCMLWFCIRWYNGALWKRLLAIFSQVIVLSWASVALYFLLYRPQFRAHQMREHTSA